MAIFKKMAAELTKKRTDNISKIGMLSISLAMTAEKNHITREVNPNEEGYL